MAKKTGVVHIFLEAYCWRENARNHVCIDIQIDVIKNLIKTNKC